jgi:hypothetical protein
VEVQKIGGRQVQNVTGWVISRHCGCAIGLGMRMDTMEPTAGVWPCDQHGAEGRRALETMQRMPPNEQEIGQLFAELLERELAP